VDPLRSEYGAFWRKLGGDAGDPAGTEFGQVFHEHNLGLKIEDALRNMADRVGLPDVRFFVTAVPIQRQAGGGSIAVRDSAAPLGRVSLPASRGSAGASPSRAACSRTVI
jgi:hypothetical protein